MKRNEASEQMKQRGEKRTKRKSLQSAEREERNMDAVLVTVDECLRTTLRELMAQATKAVNGTAATAVSLITNRPYYSILRANFAPSSSDSLPHLHVSRPSSFHRLLLHQPSSPSSNLPRLPPPPNDHQTANCSDSFLRVHTTSSRRGWGEHFQLYLELLIARLFLLLRSIAQFALSIATLHAMRESSPSSSARSWLFSPSSRLKSKAKREHVRDRKDGLFDEGKPDGKHRDDEEDDFAWFAPPSRQQRQQLSEEVPARGAPQPLALIASALFGEDAAMHDECRSTEDFIRAAGYTYELLRCATADGYIVYMHRVPNKRSKCAVLFAHGLADTGLGWVCGGITSSHAFAASDEGKDVFLADFRGAPPREHINPDLPSAEYWHFTLDELGLEDLFACVKEIQRVKRVEHHNVSDNDNDKSDSSSNSSSEGNAAADGAQFQNAEDHQGMRTQRENNANVSEGVESLKLVAHSTGCIAAMEYAVMCKVRGLHHGLSGIVLLCPAGFHMHNLPFLFYPMMALDYFFRKQMLLITPGVYIPTKLLRLLMNKLTQDLQNIPAVAELVKVVIGSGLFGGDASDWTQALAMPHYNVKGMPGVSMLMLLHFEQVWQTSSFTTFNWWSFMRIEKIARRVAMRTRSEISPLPGEVIDIGAHYGSVDVPVDLVGGTTDYVVAPDNVVEHQRRLSEAGVPNTLRWFTLAHLDAIHRPTADLRAHVLSCVKRQSANESTLNEPTHE
jgi:pimeloyl-ACP methyl ester carboxylesterase